MPFISLNAAPLVSLGVPLVNEPTVVALGAPSAFILLVLAFVPGHGAFGFFDVDGFFQGFDHISGHFVPFLDIDDPGHFATSLGSGWTFSFSWSLSLSSPSLRSGATHVSDVGIEGRSIPSVLLSCWVQYLALIKGRGRPST